MDIAFFTYFTAYKNKYYLHYYYNYLHLPNTYIYKIIQRYKKYRKIHVENKIIWGLCIKLIFARVTAVLLFFKCEQSFLLSVIVLINYPNKTIIVKNCLNGRTGFLFLLNCYLISEFIDREN